MTYSRQVFFIAEAELNRRHVEALTVNESRTREIEIAAPEIAAVNRELINTSIELSRAVMAHNKDISKTVNKLREANLNGQKLIKTLLVDFGYPHDYLDIRFSCSKCSDTGYVNGIRCECFNELLRRYSIIELNKNCNIKLTNFNDFRLDFYPVEIDKTTNLNPREKMTSNFLACKDFVNNFSIHSKSLFMSGNTGLGKTFLSAAIANELLAKGFSVAFDSVQNYLRAIENEHFGRSSERDTLQIISDADLLIIDDLGSEFSSSFYSAALYNIINSRLNKNVPTIISSNLSLSELQMKYDDRIISRLTGMFSWMTFIGKDIRHINSYMSMRNG